jgi:signal peptidase I
MVTEFGLYLKTEKGCSFNTTNKFLQNLKRITYRCLRHGWILKDPFAGISLTMKEVDRPYLTEDELKKVKSFPFITNIVKDLNTAGFGNTFPYDTSNYKWSEDNFGPLWVPAKGASIELTSATIAAYRRVISVYEGNNLEEKNGKFFINGVETKSYTFKMNYFWLMGDNRHNSQDSRFWGFVPEDHVVGKASLIWFSWQNGPRWKRLFNVIK